MKLPKMNKHEQFLGYLEHGLTEDDVIIQRFKELFKEELKAGVEGK